MTFRDREKRRYEVIKSELWSAAAVQPGIYWGKPRPFCLADRYSAENLHASFREEAITYFRQRSIGWHRGWPDGMGNKTGLPSNHLCSSQVACVNFLYPLAQYGHLLAQVFQPFFPELAEPLPFIEDGLLPNGQPPYLAFEWIGSQNYLGEVGSRSRGANATSADFAFRFRRADGGDQLVLGEWKYTEGYGKKIPTPDTVNKTQLRVYGAAFERWSAAQPGLPDYHTFFAEPFYQLMRLTLLAQEIERAKGDGQMKADRVSVLVVVPEANRAYRYNLAAVPAIAEYGSTVSSAWKQLAPEDRFTSISTERLLEAIKAVAPTSCHPWRDYLLKRYGW